MAIGSTNSQWKCSTARVSNIVKFCFRHENFQILATAKDDVSRVRSPFSCDFLLQSLTQTKRMRRKLLVADRGAKRVMRVRVSRIEIGIKTHFLYVRGYPDVDVVASDWFVFYLG